MSGDPGLVVPGGSFIARGVFELIGGDVVAVAGGREDGEASRFGFEGLDFYGITAIEIDGAASGATEYIRELMAEQWKAFGGEETALTERQAEKGATTVFVEGQGGAFRVAEYRRGGVFQNHCRFEVNLVELEFTDVSGRGVFS